mgnify:CR=1 FL=1
MTAPPVVAGVVGGVDVTPGVTGVLATEAFSSLARLRCSQGFKPAAPEAGVAFPFIELLRFCSGTGVEGCCD